MGLRKLGNYRHGRDRESPIVFLALTRLPSGLRTESDRLVNDFVCNGAALFTRGASRGASETSP